MNAFLSLGTACPIQAGFIALSSKLGGDEARLAGGEIEALVERARRGDPGARRKLYTQHVDGVYRTVRAVLRSDAEAEDVTQDAMMAVLTRLASYRPRPESSFRAWVMTIAINTARRRFRRRRPELTQDGELPDQPADLPDPDQALDQARLRRALLVALRDLTDREREIVSLRYGGELNASQIAAALGDVAAPAVRKILERARDRLGARIETLIHEAQA